MFCTLMVVLSTFIKMKEVCVGFPSTNDASKVKPGTNITDGFCRVNDTNKQLNGAYYTGISSETFKDNLERKLRQCTMDPRARKKNTNYWKMCNKFRTGLVICLRYWTGCQPKFSYEIYVVTTRAGSGISGSRVPENFSGTRTQNWVRVP